ncbi:MAG: ferrous iron transport protein B [Ignavibacteria bacterium]|nr:ferrous iron transport protein B [Ignavibacteria bacterium]
MKKGLDMHQVKTKTILAQLRDNEEGTISAVRGSSAFRKRIAEMGFVKGKTVKVIKNAPLQDPVEYEIMGYNVSLRRSEAGLVEVYRGDSHIDNGASYFGILDGPTESHVFQHDTKTISVALVGNPNCGKTTLFNFASGLHERVGNYGGVTVDAKEAEVRVGDYRLILTDLPGTYSVTEYTPEELFVRMHLMNNRPDVVINVIDSSNLERNLFLTTQLIDMNQKMVIALNMFDELTSQGAGLDYLSLGKMLGIPMIPTVGSKGQGLDTLFEKVIAVFEGREQTVRSININYGTVLENCIDGLTSAIAAVAMGKVQIPSRYLAIKLLEGDTPSIDLLKQKGEWQKIEALRDKLVLEIEKEYRDKPENVFTDARYGFIAGALEETFQAPEHVKKSKSLSIDSVITHKYLGFPLFGLIMWFIFQFTFSLGKFPMEWIQSLVDHIHSWVSAEMPIGPLRDLISDGVINGVGSVLVFLPNILLLFFFISVLEDTGYMARAAFIMDKIMHKIGLHGKSFIPLLMGFGCNVPAVMSTRTLENRKDRILTMLIIPFMSCSARLPVYVLIISATFTRNQGGILFLMYIIGIIVAVFSAMIMKKIMFRNEEAPFVMELPPYRIPTLRNTIRHMWFKAAQYLRKMGNVILVASVIIWALGYFPRTTNFSMNYDSAISTLAGNNQITATEKEKKLSELELAKESERQAHSYIGRVGHFIEPVIAPLGFDWKIGMSIITGLAAKEIVVSTMAVLYQADEKSDDGSVSLKDKLAQQVYTHGPQKGEKIFTPLVAMSLMIFVLIYFPCIAVIAAIRKEANLRWAIFTMVYTTAIAWVLAFITYQGGRFLL